MQARGEWMRVLIVEDQVKMTNYLQRALQEQGYAVDVTHTGREALEWASVVEFDMIVLDLMLPEIDGLTVCRTLRSQGYPSRILMLTARDTVDDRVRGLDTGADDYLVKPFALQELLARLRALARRPPQSVPNVYQVEDLVMNSRTRVVKRGNRVINLTAKEYAVLECLLRDPDRVLTRTEIAEAVWNYDVYNQSNIVDVYIRNLRRKIDDHAARKLIQTVRGAGYRLSARDEGE
jgi:DNA-binding response OmpR family regulator